MGKIKKQTRFKLMLIGIVVALFIVTVLLLRWPWYLVTLSYIATFAVLAFFYRRNMLAIIGNIHYITGRKEKGEKLLQKSIAMKTTSPVAHLNYAIILLKRGDWETALSLLDRAESLSPDIISQKNILMTKGSCYWIKGDVKGAIEILEDLRSRFEYVNGHVLTTLAYMYFLDGDDEKALATTQEAIADMPEWGAAWDNMGQIYYKQGKLAEAREAFEKALSYQESLVDSLYFMGQICEQEGDSEKARDYFTRAKACDISALNTVTEEQIDQKVQQYSKV